MGRALFIAAFLPSDKDKTYPEHQNGDGAKFIQAMNQYVSTNELSKCRPFVIGQKITYADLVIYEICHDEQLIQDGRNGVQDYPRLVMLVDAVDARPNVKKFLESDRYLG